MVIDFHTHIFPDKIATGSIAHLEKASGITAATDGTLNGLLASMEKNNVDMSVILPVVTKPSQFESVNQFASWVNERYRGRLISFGGIHPDSEDYKKELDKIKELGLPGIKLHPDYQKVMIDDERNMRIIEYADSLGLMILVHAGIDIGLPTPVHCPPEKAARVIDALRPKKMILAHLGGWKQWEDVYELLAGKDVYLDTSFTFDYMEQDFFLKILEKHGHEKVLFATDSPWSDVGKAVEVVRNMPLSHDKIEDILAGNARKLLSLYESSGHSYRHI